MFIMSISPAIPVLLTLLLIGVWPKWPFSRKWGYRPAGTVSLILIVSVVLILSGKL